MANLTSLSGGIMEAWNVRGLDPSMACFHPERTSLARGGTVDDCAHPRVRWRKDHNGEGKITCRGYPRGGAPVMEGVRRHFPPFGCVVLPSWEDETPCIGEKALLSCHTYRKDWFRQPRLPGFPERRPQLLGGLISSSPGRPGPPQGRRSLPTIASHSDPSAPWKRRVEKEDAAQTPLVLSRGAHRKETAGKRGRGTIRSGRFAWDLNPPRRRLEP